MDKNNAYPVKFLDIDGNKFTTNKTGEKDQNVAFAIKVMIPVFKKVAINIFLA